MSAFWGKADITAICPDVCFSNRPVMGWTRRAPASCSRKPAWGCEYQEHSHVTSNVQLIILRQKLSRGQVYARLANIPACLIGMEACVGAHHLGRHLRALGHATRLMPARYVRC